MAHMPDAGSLVISVDIGTFGSFTCFGRNTGPVELVDLVAGHDMSYAKRLTIVLLKRSDPSYASFGQEARQTFMLARGEERTDFLYFENFKMQLLQEGREYNFDTPVHTVDKSGQMPLGGLLKLCLENLVEASLQHYNRRRHGNLQKHQVRVVITVPAIWPPMSCEAMVRCCQEIGIDRRSVVIASEPEAGACFVVYDDSLGAEINPGDQWVCLDVGAGTFDMVCHQMVEDRKIEEVFYRDGLRCGSNLVDEKFEELLGRAIGAEHVARMKNSPEFTELYVEQMMHFQDARCGVQPSHRHRIMSIQPLQMFVEESGVVLNLESLFMEFSLPSAGLERGCLSVRRNHLQIGQAVFAYLHEHVTKTISEFVAQKCRNSSIVSIKQVIVVGGFGKSLYVQNAIRNVMISEPNLRGSELYCPPHSELAVSKGAIHVARGHRVVSRRSRYTYGIAVDKAYSRHDGDDEDRKEHDPAFPNGWKIGGCFQMMIRQNSARDPDFRKMFRYPLCEGDCEIVIDVYKSTDRYPVYIDEESCSLAKSFAYVLPEPVRNPSSKLKVVLSFEGGTLVLSCGVDEDGAPTTVFTVQFNN